MIGWLFSRMAPRPVAPVSPSAAGRALAQSRTDRERARRRAFHRAMRAEMNLPPDPRLDDPA